MILCFVLSDDEANKARNVCQKVDVAHKVSYPHDEPRDLEALSSWRNRQTPNHWISDLRTRSANLNFLFSADVVGDVAITFSHC